VPHLVRTGSELTGLLDRARAGGAEVGFVPTMGALHAGHRALVARARVDTGLVLVSIFVNPLQFGAGEDLDAYPRDLDADLAVCAAEGVDVVFAPAAAEMWPAPPLVRVSAGSLGQVLEGAHRPGHLDGVATVVAKLLHLAGRCRAYFGRKDAQQLALVRRMVTDLAFDATIVACDTVRLPDGLALSSRNAYLSAAERVAAPALYAALRAGQAAWAADRTLAPAAIEAAAAAVLAAEPAFTVDYVSLVDPDTFQPAAVAAEGQVLAAAARLGRTRLIDNVVLNDRRDP
jgi:pantoate--beta-alanine ligase